MAGDDGGTGDTGRGHRVKVHTVDESLMALLWRHDVVFHYDPTTKMWYLSGPRNDLQHRRETWGRSPEEWSSLAVPADSLNDAVTQAIVALRGLDNIR
jgi:hypothetical protein